MSFTPYWVSPRRRENTVGPKPTMNCGTRMPKRRAQMKWPPSWNAIENSRPIANATIPAIVSSVLSSASGRSRARPRRGRRSGDGGTSVFAGPALGGQDVVHTRRGAEVRRRVEGTRDEVHDAAERQPTRQER